MAAAPRKSGSELAELLDRLGTSVREQVDRVDRDAADGRRRLWAEVKRMGERIETHDRNAMAARAEDAAALAAVKAEVSALAALTRERGRQIAALDRRLWWAVGLLVTTLAGVAAQIILQRV